MPLKFIYCNNNPFNNEISDCAIRAIAKCEGLEWEEVHKRLFKIAQIQKCICTTKSVILTYIKDRYTVEHIDIPLKYYKFKKGKRLLLLSSGNDYHLIFAENGKYYDKNELNGKQWTVIESYILN